MFGLSTVSVSLYFLFFIALISVSVYLFHPKEVTVESYFFANRNSHWLVIGISILTTSLFSPYIFGLTISGSNFELPVVYGLISIIMLVLLGWLIAPKYFKTKINTLPDYFEKRFNRKCKFFISSLYIFYNIFLRLIIILAAGNIFISNITGVDAYSFLLLFIIITGIYVIIGGLQAEIYVSIAQMLLIVLGVTGFLAWIIFKNDGVQSVIFKMLSLSYLKDGSNNEFSLPGFLLGLPVIGFWFWFTDQFMVQKVLSIRNFHSLRKAALVSICFQIIPILVFLLPGIIINLPVAESKGTLSTLFSDNILPEGLKVVLIVAVAAALMASFANLFNSTSSIITFDFYRSFNSSASNRKFVLIGRLTTLVLLVFSILLIPVSQTIDFSVCLQLFKIIAYFATLVSAIFITSLISNKINSTSALVTLCAGTLIILLRIFIQLFFSDAALEDSFLEWFTQSKFLEFSTFIFFLSILFLFAFNKIERIQSSIFKVIKMNFFKAKI